MADRQRLICASSDLTERGLGVRFEVERWGRATPAFAIRYHGKVYAYLNQCQHVPVELDFQPGDFFDLSKSWLICAVHGAYYAPDSGLCLGGPCRGRSLQALPVIEHNNHVYLLVPASDKPTGNKP